MSDLKGFVYMLRDLALTLRAKIVYFADQDGALQTASGWYGGFAAPDNAKGSNGDFYARSNGAIYYKTGGAWTQITATASLPMTQAYTAGENLTDGDVVYVSAANTVRRITSLNAHKWIGVANATVLAAASVDVVVFGRKTVTADGVVAAGDLVSGYLTGTAGRVLTFDPDHTHTFSTNSGAGAAHSHSTSTPSATVTVAGNTHSHSTGTPSTTVAIPTSTHTHSNTGTPSATSTAASVGHSHTSTNGASPTDPHSHTITNGPDLTTTVADQAHTHSTTTPSATDSAGSSTHTHSVGNPTVGETVAASGHNHGNTGNESVHTHTVPESDAQYAAGMVCGIALTAAAGAGSTFDIFVGRS